MRRSRLCLSVCPTLTLRQNREALAAARSRAERNLAIERVHHECERCGSVAWSKKLIALLQLRPKEPFGGKPVTGVWVLCPDCAKKHDAKLQKRKAG